MTASRLPTNPRSSGCARNYADFLNFADCLKRIEELQPFNDHNGDVWGPGIPGHAGLRSAATVPEALRRLARLNNADKHRTLHPAWIGGNLNFFSLVSAVPQDLQAKLGIPDPQNPQGLISGVGPLGPYFDG